MSKADKAYETMASRRMNCAQSVYTAFAEDLGMNQDLAMRVSQGFGGGMGHTGQTCGAVTGAYMALGLAQKFTTDNPRENIDKTYGLITEFNKKFQAMHKSLNCTELTGYDLSKPEEMVKAREKGVFATKCPVFVRDAVKIVEDLLNTSK